MRISDWSSDVCSSDLLAALAPTSLFGGAGLFVHNDSDAGNIAQLPLDPVVGIAMVDSDAVPQTAMGAIEVRTVSDHYTANGALGQNLARNIAGCQWTVRSEEHTSELQSLMRISYAVFCLKKQITAQDQMY